MCVLCSTNLFTYFVVKNKGIKATFVEIKIVSVFESFLNRCKIVIILMGAPEFGV